MAEVEQPTQTLPLDSWHRAQGARIVAQARHWHLQARVVGSKGEQAQVLAVEQRGQGRAWGNSNHEPTLEFLLGPVHANSVATPNKKTEGPLWQGTLGLSDRVVQVG